MAGPWAMPAPAGAACSSVEPGDRAREVLAGARLEPVPQRRGPEDRRPVQEPGEENAPAAPEVGLGHPRVLLADLPLVLVEALGAVQLKGKAAAVEVYAVAPAQRLD